MEKSSWRQSGSFCLCWLAFTMLEGSMHASGEETHLRTYPAMNPVSYNNDGPAKLCSLVQWWLSIIDVINTFFLDLKSASRDRTHFYLC